MTSSNRHPLLYILHSSSLHGTERVALDTALGLKDEFEPVLFGPPGPAMEEAERLGFEARRFSSKAEFAKSLRHCLAKYESLTFVATGVMHSAVCLTLNLLYRRRIRHYHIVHGGSSDRDSYARKRILNHTGVRFITVSEWTKQKLISYGTRAQLIDVVPNSIPADRIAAFPRRREFSEDGIRNAIMVCRLDPMKRVDTLLDALDRGPKELGEISFTVYGLGSQTDMLRQRAASTHPNIKFPGYSAEIPRLMSEADLLVHTCPVEPFGLVILEAMAANLPVLVANAAGPGEIVHTGENGFKFRPDDPDDLARQLVALRTMSAQQLNQTVAGGRVTVEETYSSVKMCARYRALFLPKL